jgi:hygromycin-B 7''-O-kinase
MNRTLSVPTGLPVNPDYDEACHICDHWRLTEWQPVLDLVIARHGLSVTDLRQNFTGSNPIFELALTDGSQLVIKVLAPNWQTQYVSEYLSLKQLEGQELGVRIPRILFSGEIDNWHYLAQERLPGTVLAELMPTLSHSQKQAIATQLGHFSRRLHGLPTDNIAALKLDWPQFISRQNQHCHDKRRRQGLRQPLLDDLLPYLAHIDPSQNTPVSDQHMLLHTDLHPWNLLVRECGGELHLAGIIDFGDALVCPEPKFEFTSVALLLALGDASLFHAYLDGYGYRGARDRTLQQSMMQLSLLRHTGDLNYLLETVPGCHEQTRWQELEQKFFPL